LQRRSRPAARLQCRRGYRFAVAFHALLIFPAPASATADVGAENARLDAIEAMYHRGQWREGYAAADPSRFISDEGKLSARYLRALGLMQLGRPDLAIAELRVILAEHPRLDRVRLTLATALRATGDEEGARHHYELLLGSELDPDLDRQIRSSLATLGADKSWSLSTYFSVIPSTNVNSGTGSDVISIGGVTFRPADGSKQQSGTGVEYGFEAGYRLPLSNDWSLIAKGGVSRRDYRGSEWDETNPAGSLGVMRNIAVGYWGAEAVVSQTWATIDSGHRAAIDSYGARLYGRFVPGSSWRFDATAEILARDYRYADVLDGYRVSAQTTIDRIIDSSRFFRGLGSGVYEKAERGDLTYHDLTLGAGLFNEWSYGISTYVQASVAGRWYHGDFAFAGEPRRDLRANGLLRIAKRDFTVLGFAPYWQVSYTTNRSNVGLYEYDKFDLDLGWTRSF
jgi:hypothetical protein